MSWTYTGDPAAISRDAVRFHVGQTSSGDEVLVTDEEIAYAIAQTNTNYTAAALVADSLAARYRQVARESERLGETSITWGDRAAKLDMLATNLRRQDSLRSVSPFLGGQSVTDRDTREQDTDLRQPAFQVEQFDTGGWSTRGVTSTA